MRNTPAARRPARMTADRSGAVALVVALMAVPLLLATGMSIDYGRMAQYQTTLQDAVDNAALAGATVYGTSSQSGEATTVATSYMAGAPLPSALTLGTPTVTAAQGTTNFNGSAYNVTVTATATMQPTLLSLFYSSFTLTATATASNPIVKLTLSTGNFGASAQDWNSTWLYAVPMSNGKPVYSSIPAESGMYEIGSNCNKAISSNYSSSSLCVGQTGATVPSGQSLPTITATQPIAFALQNMTDGLAAASTGGPVVSVSTSGLVTTTTSVGTTTSAGNTNIGYGINGYNAPPGFTNWFYSAYEALGEPPSQNTNYSYTETIATKTTQKILSYTLSSTSASVSQTETTTYPTTSSSSKPNCSLIVQQVDPNDLPTSPPSSGSCFSVTDPGSGTQYAAMTCAQMNGKTYMFWWNDMGGPSDDKDYNDAYFTVSCTTGGGSGSGNTQVVLTK